MARPTTITISTNTKAILELLPNVECQMSVNATGAETSIALTIQPENYYPISEQLKDAADRLAEMDWVSLVSLTPAAGTVPARLRINYQRRVK